MPEELPASRPAWHLLSTAREPGEDGYFEHVRRELLDLFVRPPRLFVDVGCGTGLTGLEAKRRFPDAVIDGFEYSQSAAVIAATRLDHVHHGNVEQMDFGALGYAPDAIDGLLLADVLEHLYDPWNFLVRIRPFVAPDAQIVASIPNARNLVLLNELAAGNFTYEAAGLLDVTHIRFFTRNEILKMFAETGYVVHEMRACYDGRIPALQPIVGKTNVDLSAITLRDVDQAQMTELTAIQFYARVSRR